MGDAELDEGNVYECLQEGWKHALRNVWWVIDYNRQSDLDGIIHEGLWEKAQKLLRHLAGKSSVSNMEHYKRLHLPKQVGPSKLGLIPVQTRIIPPLLGGAVWRQRLLDDLGDQGDFSKLINRRTDDELAALMENLGGNCVATMTRAFSSIEH